MKANRSEPIGHLPGLVSVTANPHPAEGMLRLIENLTMERSPSASNSKVSNVVRLLSMIAADESISERNPIRVIEAVQNYGHLLCDRDVETIRSWFVRLNHLKKQ